jgi:isopentenyldiphosphate isomerase
VKTEDEEMLEVVDRSGKVLRLARRSEVHCNPSLVHRVVHVLVFDEAGRLLLQKRSQTKDVAPGKWDTSVGGHVSPGEDIEDAARREMQEELGISDCGLTFLYRYLFSGAAETELVHTFSCVHRGPFHYNRDEIEAVEFRELDEIKNGLGKGLFSGHFEREIRTYLSTVTHPSRADRKYTSGSER